MAITVKYNFDAFVESRAKEFTESLPHDRDASYGVFRIHARTVFAMKMWHGFAPLDHYHGSNVPGNNTIPPMLYGKLTTTELIYRNHLNLSVPTHIFTGPDVFSQYTAALTVSEWTGAQAVTGEPKYVETYTNDDGVPQNFFMDYPPTGARPPGDVAPSFTGTSTTFHPEGIFVGLPAGGDAWYVPAYPKFAPAGLTSRTILGTSYPQSAPPATPADPDNVVMTQELSEPHSSDIATDAVVALVQGFNFAQPYTPVHGLTYPFYPWDNTYYHRFDPGGFSSFDEHNAYFDRDIDGVSYSFTGSPTALAPIGFAGGNPSLYSGVSLQGVALGWRANGLSTEFYTEIAMDYFYVEVLISQFNAYQQSPYCNPNLIAQGRTTPNQVYRVPMPSSTNIPNGGSVLTPTTNPEKWCDLFGRTFVGRFVLVVFGTSYAEWASKNTRFIPVPPDL